MSAPSEKHLTNQTPEQRAWMDFSVKIARFTPEEKGNIEFAYKAAEWAHINQKRISGERYFDHPRETSIILLDVGITNWKVIVAALLHDVPEDTDLLQVKDLPIHGNTDWDFVERIFYEVEEDSQTVRSIIEEVTQEEYPDLSKSENDRIYHDQLKYISEEGVVIKMADRLHNLRTLGAMPPNKRAAKIAETKEIYIKKIFNRKFKKYPEQAAALLKQINEELDQLAA